jgi:hypothetical protein
VKKFLFFGYNKKDYFWFIMTSFFSSANSNLREIATTTGKKLGFFSKTKIDELVDILNDFDIKFKKYTTTVNDVRKVNEKYFSEIFLNDIEQQSLIKLNKFDFTGDVFLKLDENVYKYIKHEYHDEIRNKIANFDKQNKNLFCLLFHLRYIYFNFFLNNEKYEKKEEFRKNTIITIERFIHNYNTIYKNYLAYFETNDSQLQKENVFYINSSIDTINEYIIFIKSQQIEKQRKDRQQLSTPVSGEPSSTLTDNAGLTGLAGGSNNLRHSIDLIIQLFKKQRPSLNINPDLLYNCVVSYSNKNNKKPLRKYNNQRTKR